MPIYLCLMLVQAICFSMFFTVQLIYHVTVIGLSPLQMVLVGVVLEVVTFAFEIPTGVVADVFSRRRSILIGILLMGCSYTLEGAVALFWAALLSQVFWGIGYTFTSGANQAWITDEIGEDAVGQVFLRGRQMWLLGIVTGTLLAMLLGVLHIQLPMVLAGVGMLALSLALLLLMPERHMTPAPAEVRSTWGHMRATAQAGMRLSLARPVVRTVVLISLIVGLASEGFERLSTPQLIGRFTFPTLFGSDSPVLWFGLSGVVGALLGLLASELFRRNRRAGATLGSNGQASARLLAALAATDVAAVAIFALGGNLLLAFAMLWVRSMVSAISVPVQAAWLNRHLDPATRATVISLSGQANSIGQVPGGLALGWVANRMTIGAALLGSALILSPTVALYQRMAGRSRTPADSPLVREVVDPAD